MGTEATRRLMMVSRRTEGSPKCERPVGVERLISGGSEEGVVLVEAELKGQGRSPLWRDVEDDYHAVLLHDKPASESSQAERAIHASCPTRGQAESAARPFSYISDQRKSSTTWSFLPRCQSTRDRLYQHPRSAATWGKNPGPKAAAKSGGAMSLERQPSTRCNAF